MSIKQDEKLGVEDFKYDKNTKGWLGPIIAKRMMSSKISRLRANKKKQDEQNAKSKLGNVKKDLVDATEVNLDDDDDDSASVDDENALEVPPLIKRPFSGSQKRDKYANWRAPEKLRKDRVEEFKWSKPAPSAESSSFVSPAQQVIRLKEDLKAKDKEIALLRGQLMKSQRENFSLAEHLKKFEGDDYDKLKQVNATLKDHLDRACRENIKLTGMMKQEQNKKLHHLEWIDKLNDKFSVATLKHTSTPRKGGGDKILNSKLRTEKLSSSVNSSLEISSP